MGRGLTEVTMAQLAGVVGRYSNVIYMNDPDDGDLLKTIVGSPRTLVINLGQLLNIASGEVQGDAIAIDEIEATEIADGAVGGRELAETPSLFQTATEATFDHDTGTGATLVAANAAGGGDRLVICQAEVTATFVSDSWEIDVGSSGDPNGLFDNIFAGLATLAINETLAGAYLLPEGEALTVTKTSMVNATAGQLTFRLIVMAPAANSIPGNLLADEAIGHFAKSGVLSATPVTIAHDDAPSPVEILALDAANDRLVLVLAVASETAVGGPDFDVGSEITDPNAMFDDLGGGTWVVGDRWVGLCMLPAGEALDCTITAAGSAGEIDFYVIPLTVQTTAGKNLFVGTTDHVQNFGTGAGELLAANNPGEGDRLLIVQAECTTAFAGTAWDWDIGSSSSAVGLFEDIFGGNNALAIGRSVIGTYLLPEGEALALVENLMTMTAGQVTFRIHISAPAAGSIPGALLANDAVGHFDLAEQAASEVNVAFGDTPSKQLLGADANNDRLVMVMGIATVTAATAPEWDVGVAGGNELFDDISGGTWVAGERFFGACILPATSILDCTLNVAGSAGAIDFYIIALTPIVQTAQIADAAVTGVKIANDAVNFPDVITPTSVAFGGGVTQPILASSATQDRIVLVTAIVTASAQAGICDWDVGGGGGAEVFEELASGNWEVGDRYVGAMLLLQDEALNVTLQTAGNAGVIDFYVTELFIKVRTAQLYDDAVTDAKILSQIVKDEGVQAHAILRATGVTADGEDITIGADTYEVDPIVAASGDLCDGNDFNDGTSADLVVEMDSVTYANIGVGTGGALILGELVYIDTEYLRVIAIGTPTANDVTFQRGAGGSAIAAHVGTTAIFISAATPSVFPNVIPVGVQANFAQAACTPIFAATINEAATEDISADDVMGDGTVLFVVANAVGVVTLGTTENHGNGVWDFTAMRRGVAAAVRQQANITIVPDAEEVASGDLFVPLPFDAAVVQVLVITTATGLVIAWLGNVEIVAAAGVMPAYLILDNVAAGDWSVNETIHITVTS